MDLQDIWVHLVIEGHLTWVHLTWVHVDSRDITWDHQDIMEDHHPDTIWDHLQDIKADHLDLTIMDSDYQCTHLI